jgi:uncharacterized damage-inducible protein DinB
VNEKLQHIFDRLEKQRVGLLGELKNYSIEQLNQHPNKKWSVNEILSHLIAAERLSLQYLQKKIQGVNETKDSGIWEELKMLLLKISQRIPGLKFKAPKIVLERTTSHDSLTTLEGEWAQLRKEVRAFLETVQDDHIKRNIYRHAVAGRLNIQHALLFFREHIIHHRPQIKSLLKSK